MDEKSIREQSVRKCSEGPRKAREAHCSNLVDYLNEPLFMSELKNGFFRGMENAMQALKYGILAASIISSSFFYSGDYYSLCKKEKYEVVQRQHETNTAESDQDPQAEEQGIEDRISEENAAPDNRTHPDDNTRRVLAAGIPIMMYHKMDRSEAYNRYNINPDEFRTQLQRLYDEGFTLISIEDFVNKDLSSVPAGRKPAVMTFDDSEKSQFSYLEERGRVVLDDDGNPVLDPDCAFAILRDFYTQHPDFGKKATFFVDFVDNKTYERQAPFGQEGYEGLKINRLLKEGMFVGDHTYNHIRMASSSREKIAEEISVSMEKLRKYLGEDISQVDVMAYPYGSLPSGVDSSILSVTHEGRTYSFIAAMHAWGGCAYPYSKIYEIPRIETNRETFDRFILHRGSVPGT